jgi:hypothetical protein
MPTCTALTPAAASKPLIVRTNTMQTLVEIAAGFIGFLIMWAFLFVLLSF